MPWKEPGFWDNIFGDWLLLIPAVIGGALGRMFHWTNNVKRMPTWREFIAEIFLVMIVGMFWGGVLQQIPDIEPGPIYGGVVAVGSIVGVKGIVKFINMIAKRFLGLSDDICHTDDIIKIDDRGEKK